MKVLNLGNQQISFFEKLSNTPQNNTTFVFLFEITADHIFGGTAASFKLAL
jgi:hypothetical protein